MRVLVHVDESPAVIFIARALQVEPAARKIELAALEGSSIARSSHHVQTQNHVGPQLLSQVGRLHM